MNNLYTGAAGHIVHVKAADGATRLLPPRNDILNHSPDGFSWGYLGSGPSQLALAILAHEYGDDSVQIMHYHEFMVGRIASIQDTRNFTISSGDIAQWWLNHQKAVWRKGQRVRYVPSHANGDPQHPACESGCIKRVRDADAAFVLYDVKGGHFKMATGDEPFTAAPTHFDDLVKLDDEDIDVLEETRRLYKYLTNDTPNPELTQEELYDTIKQYDA